MTPPRLIPLRDRLRAAPCDAGFTMIEVIVAFVLFAVVSSTATYGIYNAIKASHQSQQRADAGGVAQSYIADAQGSRQTVTTETERPFSAFNGHERFTVLRSITFSQSGETQCAQGSSFTVNVVVKQAETGKFLARSDSVIAC